MRKYTQSTQRTSHTIVSPLFALVCVVLVVVFAAVPAGACPFCSDMGKTLTENVQEAGLVVYGALSNATLEPEGTDLEIKIVVKDHPAIAGKKRVRLPRYLSVGDTEKADYLVFAEIIDGKIDPYRGMPVDDQRFVDYLAGAVKHSKAKTTDQLGFFFKYLGDEDINISGDAYKEFANAPYADVVAASKHYDPAKLVQWLQDKNSPSYRIGLYGCLLGAAGGPEHAKVLYDLISDPKARPLTGVDGLMGGYCVLNPTEGPDFVLGVLGDPERDFNFRYSALRTVRFILSELPQVKKDDVFAKMSEAIHIPDIADLIIDEFRKNKRWEPLDDVLALYDKDEFSLQVVRRSVIRFALKCPDPKAKAFVGNLRKRDPQLVADVEEILKFEETSAAQFGSGG